VKDHIRRLSWRAEFAIVLFLAFGWTLPGTLRAVMAPSVVARGPMPPISDARVWDTIIFEMITFGLLIPFLRARGWTLARLGFRFSLRGMLQGVTLAIAAYSLYLAFVILAVNLRPDVARALASTHLVSSGISWTTILAACAINPFYEEIFVCGYVVSVLSEQRRDASVGVVALPTDGELRSTGAASRISAPRVSLSTAVSTSAFIRLSYHLYQGVAGVLSVTPLGLLFGWWFARRRQLWPLIVAHAVLDFVGLAAGAR
jgi:membrane protease YdiL (CAAX protease family)